jgi:hypothetical protein
LSVEITLDVAHDEIVVHRFGDDLCHGRGVELDEGVVLGFSGLSGR